MTLAEIPVVGIQGWAAEKGGQCHLLLSGEGGWQSGTQGLFQAPGITGPLTTWPTEVGQELWPRDQLAATGL